jgi:DNA adenine methylase
MALPIIKSLGGKSYLLPLVGRLLSQVDCGRLDYMEPCVGGGAIMFAYGDQFHSVTISDVNPDLINLYRVIRDDVESLIRELKSELYFFNAKDGGESVENFRAIRYWQPTDPVRRAARYRYLLTCCFRGLARHNTEGEFNTAPGDYVNPRIVEPLRLLAASEFLQAVDILGPADAARLIRDRAGPETLLTIDPPYDGDESQFSDFYGTFDALQQLDLIEATYRSGARFIYTNRLTRYTYGFFNGCGDVKFATRPLHHKIVRARRPEYELIAYRL